MYIYVYIYNITHTIIHINSQFQQRSTIILYQSFDIFTPHLRNLTAATSHRTLAKRSTSWRRGVVTNGVWE